jgi:hypothetical protein
MSTAYIMASKRCSLHRPSDHRTPHIKILRTKPRQPDLNSKPTIAHLNNLTRTCMTARKSGIHIFNRKHSCSPGSKKKKLHTSTYSVPDWYSPNPSAAKLTPTVMNVKNTSRETYTSLDPRSFSFGSCSCTIYGERTSYACREKVCPLSSLRTNTRQSSAFPGRYTMVAQGPISLATNGILEPLQDQVNGKVKSKNQLRRLKAKQKKAETVTVRLIPHSQQPTALIIVLLDQRRRENHP